MQILFWSLVAACALCVAAVKIVDYLVCGAIVLKEPERLYLFAQCAGAGIVLTFGAAIGVALAWMIA